MAIVLFLDVNLSTAQNFFQTRQFYFSPQLLNSAYTGIDDKANILLYYRKQWIDIDDSPENYGLNFQYATKNNLSLGFSFNSSKTVLLRSDGLLITLAYRVPISETSSLRFGISGGVSFYRLDPEGTDYSNDPAILNLMSGSSYAIGNFGALYSIKKIKIGISLPELFGKSGLTRSGKFTQLLSQVYSVSGDYKFKTWNEDTYITNYLLYRLSYDYQNNWEAGAVLNVRNIVRAGFSYRQQSGFGFLLGLRAISVFGFSYTYEARPVESEFINTYTHEIHLDIIIRDVLKEKLKPVDDWPR